MTDLKSKEIRNGFAEATNNSLFFRSGKKNQWAKELSINQQKKIKEVFNFKQSAKDLLITSQLRSAMIFNKKIKQK